jgi:hypothetical protein
MFDSLKLIPALHIALDKCQFFMAPLSINTLFDAFDQSPMQIKKPLEYRRAFLIISSKIKQSQLQHQLLST